MRGVVVSYRKKLTPHVQNHWVREKEFSAQTRASADVPGVLFGVLFSHSGPAWRRGCLMTPQTAYGRTGPSFG